MADYTGEEKAIELADSGAVEPDSIFDLRPPGVPSDAVPIYDDEMGAVVGYSHLWAGYYSHYDLQGAIVGRVEQGLQDPLIDPLDLIFFIAGIFRAVLKGAIKAGSRAAVITGSKLAVRGLSVAVVGAMRATFKGLSVRALKFTETTAARMAAKGRYVPRHILHLAIKYGRRGPDPQGAKGAFQYVAKMFRNGTEYTLEVVVRESDWTILHFLYK